MLLLIQGNFFTPEQSAQVAMIVVTLLSAISGPFSAACWYLTLKIRAAQQEFQAEQRAKDEEAAKSPRFAHSRREDRAGIDRDSLSPVRETTLERLDPQSPEALRVERENAPRPMPWKNPHIDDGGYPEG